MLNIFYFKSNNFGDSINNLFWNKITNNNIENDKKKKHYLTTGSIMHFGNNESIVYGSGFISNKSKYGNGKKKPYKVISVRGPLTRDKLLKQNIECPENYGDPLIIFPCIYNLTKKVDDNIIGIIPHYIDKNNDNLKTLTNNLIKSGYIVKIIDIEVGEDYKSLINNINECKYIISSSLHGIIMGIVYKKLTIFLKFSNKVIGDKFKFNDFFYSININNYIYKEDYTHNIIDNTIDVDYKKLNDVAKKFILICPFINDKRKTELISIYNNFYL